MALGAQSLILTPQYLVGSGKKIRGEQNNINTPTWATFLVAGGLVFHLGAALGKETVLFVPRVLLAHPGPLHPASATRLGTGGPFGPGAPGVLLGLFAAVADLVVRARFATGLVGHSAGESISRKTDSFSL